MVIVSKSVSRERAGQKTYHKVGQNPLVESLQDAVQQVLMDIAVQQLYVHALAESIEPLARLGMDLIGDGLELRLERNGTRCRQTIHRKALPRQRQNASACIVARCTARSHTPCRSRSLTMQLLLRKMGALMGA